MLDSVTYLDMKDVSLEYVLEEAQMIPLFEDKKVIVLRHSSFLGSKSEKGNELEQLIDYCSVIHQNGKKTALYSGRDCDIEDWMYCFDYVKTGSYQKEYGSLVFPTTNQKLYKKQNNKFENITSIFWNN